MSLIIGHLFDSTQNCCVDKRAFHEQHTILLATREQDHERNLMQNLRAATIEEKQHNRDTIGMKFKLRKASIDQLGASWSGFLTLNFIHFFRN